MVSAVAIDRHAGKKVSTCHSFPLFYCNTGKQNHGNWTTKWRRVSADQGTLSHSLGTNKDDAVSVTARVLKVSWGYRLFYVNITGKKESMKATSCPCVVLHKHQWKRVCAGPCQLHGSYTCSSSACSSQPSVDMLSAQIWLCLPDLFALRNVAFSMRTWQWTHPCRCQWNRTERETEIPCVSVSDKKIYYLRL